MAASPSLASTAAPGSARGRGVGPSAGLSADIGAALEQRIRSGAYAPGARLPTEMALAAEFGVSRAVVREAVARLKADGLVASRQGSGMSVAARPDSGSFKLAPGTPAGEALSHIFELRALVETGAAELAAVAPPPPPPDPRTVHWDHGSGDRSPQAWGSLHPEFAACSQGMRQSPIHITAQDVEAGPAPLCPSTTSSSDARCCTAGMAWN